MFKKNYLYRQQCVIGQIFKIRNCNAWKKNKNNNILF